MKHIKKFEYFTDKPEIDDYIIVNINNEIGQSYDEIFDFLNNSIGKVVGYSFPGKVKVKFYNIPKNLYSYFNDDNVKAFQLKDVLAFGKDKAELIIQKKAREYNL